MITCILYSTLMLYVAYSAVYIFKERSHGNISGSFHHPQAYALYLLQAY